MGQLVGRRGTRVVVAGLLIVATVAAVSSTGGAQPAPAPDATGGFQVYRGVVDAATVSSIVDLGVDRHELRITSVGDGNVGIEVVLNEAQAATLVAKGAELTTTSSASRRTTALAETVFRPYSGDGGIQAELKEQAATHPKIAQLQSIGTTQQGKSIDAVRVTLDPSKVRAGRRPTTVYLAAQHAREWITPEMIRRLLAHYLDNYGTDPAITKLVNENELWFVPVANPDGYDYTFADPDNRLWRKNLRDNNLDGQITGVDGVDLNRNLPTRWGYDDEGSSPLPSSETYRGPEAGSEPETKAIDALFRRITPEFAINYHSAAELLLHGIGWQVATPSPDDVLYQSMLGDDAHPAVPGYDPDIAAELYTTNGEFDGHMQEEHGTLVVTPEMSTCETASDKYDDDAWVADDCGSGFEFPDDERLIEEEFENNLAFALATAQSAADPDDPVSVVGLDTPNFVVDSFTVSYGDPQDVAVTAKQALRGLRMQYRINGGRVFTDGARQWRGGERYGFENDDYYAEYRGTVRRTKAGDHVEVWFTAVDPEPRGRRAEVESEHFTYTVASDTGNPVLVLVDEDRNGVNPEELPPGGPPKYLDEHLAALTANGITADVWNVDTQGVPHDLAVLDHYKAVVWYLGDNRLTQDPEDVITEFPAYGLEVEDSSVAEREQYVTMAVRDFLNEGGKLVHAGETTALSSLFDDLYLGGALGGIYYGLDGAPDQPCVVASDWSSDCLILANDFAQYYLGAFSREAWEADGVLVTAGDDAGDQAAFGGPATVDNPIDEVGGFRVTSDVLPPDQFPAFASGSAMEYVGLAGGIQAVEGEFAVAADHLDGSYMRLGRTFDLTATTAGAAPTFDAQLQWSTEEGFDHVLVEAHTVGEDDWTTLPDLGGATTTAVSQQCEQGYYLDAHPWLSHYLTLGNPCTPSGSSGAWNAFTGESEGWVPVSFDLSAFAGSQVEVVVSYVSDPATGGLGAIVDDTRLTTTAGVSEAEGFEAGLGAWSVLGAPPGSFQTTVDWKRSRHLGPETAGVVTEDSVLLGFGIEQLDGPAAQAEVLGDALRLIGVRTPR